MGKARIKAGKQFIYGININIIGELADRIHHLGTKRVIKLVVRTGHHYAILFNQILNLEVRNKFLNAKLFGNRANRDNATVVIAKGDDGLIPKIRSHHFFSATVKARRIAEKVHHAPIFLLRGVWILTERVTTPSSEKSSPSLMK